MVSESESETAENMLRNSAADRTLSWIDFDSDAVEKWMEWFLVETSARRLGWRAVVQWSTIEASWYEERAWNEGEEEWKERKWTKARKN